MRIEPLESRMLLAAITSNGTELQIALASTEVALAFSPTPTGIVSIIVDGAAMGTFAPDAVDRLVIYGNDLNNNINLSGIPQGAITQAEIYGGAGDDFVVGSMAPDLIILGDGNDIAAGGGQSDTLQGNSGNDTLMGNSSPDDLQGGNGDDDLIGGNGLDRIDGNVQVEIEIDECDAQCAAENAVTVTADPAMRVSSTLFGRMETKPAVFPGQTIPLRVFVTDKDTVRIGNMPEQVGILTKTGYQATVEVTNAKLKDGTRKTTLQLDYVYASSESLNRELLDILIDQDLALTDKVTVKITATDTANIALPPGAVFAAGTNAQSAQDNPVVVTYELVSAAGRLLPTTMDAILQVNDSQSKPLFSWQPSVPTMIFYKFGPDSNGADPSANYGGLFVDETFSSWTTNVKPDWMQNRFVDEVKMVLKKDNVTGDDVFHYFLNKDGIRPMTSAFIIDGSNGANGDTIVDSYKNRGMIELLGSLLKENVDRDILLERVSSR